MISIAENALIDHKDLKKVIVLKHVPGFDEPLREKLAKAANKELNKLVKQSTFKNRIIVGHHDLFSYGSGKLTQVVILILEQANMTGYISTVKMGPMHIPQVRSYVDNSVKTSNRFEILSEHIEPGNL